MIKFKTPIKPILLLLIFSKDAMAMVNLGITSVGIIFVGFIYGILFGVIPTYFLYRKYKNKRIWFLTPIIGLVLYVAFLIIIQVIASIL